VIRLHHHPDRVASAVVNGGSLAAINGAGRVHMDARSSAAFPGGGAVCAERSGELRSGQVNQNVIIISYTTFIPG
jgi:hypothetical protein